MLRLSPPGFERFLQSPILGATFGGGEANVAVCVAQFGLESRYVTRLPNHAIGDGAVRALRAEGVRTDFIVRGGDRVGIYFAEAGASQRASTVIYDRARSATSEMAPGTVDWASVCRRGLVHTTGITPALANAVACRRRSKPPGRWRPHQRRPNFRKKPSEKQASGDAPLMPLVDVVIANGRTSSRSSACTPRHRRDQWPAQSRRLRGRGAADQREFGCRRSRSRSAKACRRATTAGARCSGTARPASSITASTTTSASSIASAAATASPPA
jgi:sugar/nucleoside kinase (ribokinase family)